MKPDNMEMASFDAAGKAIMNLLAEGGHGARVQLAEGTVFSAYTNHSCVYPRTSLGSDERVTVYPQNNGLVYVDGGYIVYWIANASLPAWVETIPCGAYVRAQDVEVVKQE